MRRSTARAAAWLMIALAAPTTHAGVDEGLAWLATRDGPGGVHAASDMHLRTHTNAEAWLAVTKLGAESQFPGLHDAVAAEPGHAVEDLARASLLLFEAGMAADELLDEVLADQQADGGFPVETGHGSDPVTTAWALLALDRAGRAGQTPFQRALGYLIVAQQPGGGWGHGLGTPPSAYGTAIVARTLQQFESRYAITPSLEAARSFLEGLRQPDYSFGEAFESAVAIEALVALRSGREWLAPSVTELASRQSVDGSFAGDAFLTALALRALWAWQQPVVDPGFAGLRGRVIAADTDLPIAGASLTLTGAGSITLTSNNSGELTHDALPPGAYQGLIAYPGMGAVEFTMTLVAGRILDLGDVRLYQGPSSGFSLVRGVVVSSQDDTPVPGAVVSLQSPPNQVLADADGRFQFLQVPPGPASIHAAAEGFSSLATMVVLHADSIVDLSMRLTPQEEPLSGALVQGVVRHGSSGEPLPGVLIAVTGGAAPASTTSGGDGSYALAVDLEEGLVSIAATLDGFDPVALQSLLVEGQVLAFSPKMYPLGETPEGANRSTVSGRVVNQANRHPIANALIVATDPSGQQSVRSSGSGEFALTGLAGPAVSLSITADAFDPASVLVPVLPLEERRVGDIGLKPTALDYYLADLRIVGSSLSVSEPDSFALSHSFEVEIANHGSAAVVQDFTLIAFIDGNGDGAHDDASEPVVGQVRVTDDLAIGGATVASIAASAQLSFRDAPVGFIVDSGQEVPEEDEDNNAGSSLLGCRIVPAFIGDDTVYEAWRWSGLASDPTVNSLNQTPVVGQLTDDNGDGVINAYDVPDIVFVAGRRSTSTPSKTALVAISGDDGREHWYRTDIRLSQFTSLALGDIDNDAIVEIVAVRNYREELVAFEHDGTVKWRVALDGPGMPAVLIPPPPYVYDLPVIVNLEGDNEAEVILGREVFRGSTGEQLWEGEFDAGGDGGLPIHGELAVAFGIGAIAADIDMDGIVDVVAGRTAYNTNGQALWHRADIKPDPGADTNGVPTNQSGLNAVGNFDLDDFAEIVLAIDDELWLLEHTGETIWGPVHAPDFGELGPPTVVDLDADGLPEIVISSNTRLTVFETDGTVKWTTAIEDGSGVTAATVFDFENDGLHEVVHVDEESFRILDALTGARLYQTRHTSRTVYESPVVADIDGDRQAEILLTGFDDDFVAGTTPGLRVFKARDGAWADAGSVWGSSAFHISDVMEDGTVPLLETPSWLTHNTYRVQRSPLPDPLGLPDFTLGNMQLIDRGPGLEPVLRVHAGNAGPVDGHEPPWIGLFDGDPADGGTLLVERRLDTLRPARFQIVDLPLLATPASGSLVAVIDHRQRAGECRETNNRRSIPVAAANGSGQLTVAADDTSYAPGSVAKFTASVANLGTIPVDFLLELQVVSDGGTVVHAFPPQTLMQVRPGTPAQVVVDWPAEDVLGGHYRLTGELRNPMGTLADSAHVAFLVAGTASGPAARVDVVLERGSYRPQEPVPATVRAVNQSDDDIIRSGRLSVTVEGASGVVQQREFAIGDLFPGASFAVQMSVENADISGPYVINARLYSDLTGDLLATGGASFERLADVSEGLEGDVAVLTEAVAAGAGQSCWFTVRNPAGQEPRSQVPVRLQLVSEAAGAVLWSLEQPVDLPAGTSWTHRQDVPAGTLAGGLHVCALETAGASGWRMLDSHAFVVAPPAAPAIHVNPNEGLVTSERGATAAFTVVLGSRPTSDVRIAIESGDASEWSVAPTVLAFSPDSWSLPRTVTVTGVDDALLDGDQSGVIAVLPAVSQDPLYAGLDPQDVAVQNLDDDGARILVAPLVVETAEDGTSATVRFSLTTAPTASVTVALVNPDPGEWELAASSVVFEPATWQDERSVVVRGIADGIVDGTREGWLLVQPATSADAAYAGFDTPDVLLRNADIDTAGILVEPAIVATRENGPAAAFSVRLTTQPLAEVRLAIGPVDASEWLVKATELVLDDGNWSTGVMVPVVPRDDDLVDGDQAWQLVLGPAQSTDPHYAGMQVPSVQLGNADDDAPRILVQPAGPLVTGEDGSSAQLTVQINGAPTAPVTIGLVNPDPGEWLLSEDLIVFGPDDWQHPRAITVHGVDDEVVDGDRIGVLELRPAQSVDERFAGLDPDDLGLVNLDDDADGGVPVAPGQPRLIPINQTLSLAWLGGLVLLAGLAAVRGTARRP